MDDFEPAPLLSGISAGPLLSDRSSRKGMLSRNRPLAPVRSPLPLAAVRAADIQDPSATASRRDRPVAEEALTAIRDSQDDPRGVLLDSPQTLHGKGRYAKLLFNHALNLIRPPALQRRALPAVDVREEYTL